MTQKDINTGIAELVAAIDQDVIVVTTPQQSARLANAVARNEWDIDTSGQVWVVPMFYRGEVLIIHLGVERGEWLYQLEDPACFDRIEQKLRDLKARVAPPQ